MIREIIQAPDPRLLVPSARVSKLTREIMALANDLNDTRRCHDGAGLSAVQIGVHLTIVAVHPARFHGFRTLINPFIVERSGNVVEEDEGCLSIGKGVTRFKIKRHTDCVVRFMDRNGDDRMVRSTGFAARLIQHEIDHFEGKLIG